MQTRSSMEVKGEGKRERKQWGEEVKKGLWRKQSASGSEKS